MKVLGISLITNAVNQDNVFDAKLEALKKLGLSEVIDIEEQEREVVANHEEVLETSKSRSKAMESLVNEIVLMIKS